MDELNGTMAKIVDDFPVPLSKLDSVKAAFPRIADVFSVQITVGMKALDRFSRMQWLRLCGERLQVVHAKEYINALCTPEESHTIDYPPHMDPVLRDPQTLKNLERQSKALLDIEDGYKIKISGSCTGYVMAMSAVEDIIARGLRNMEDNEADIVNASPVQETSSKLLNQELRRIVSQDDTIVIDDEDFENFESMPNPVKRTMIGCLIDENLAAFARHKEKAPIENKPFQGINLITGIEGNAEPLFYIEDVDAAGPSRVSQTSRPRRSEDIVADGPSRLANNNKGQSSVFEMTRKTREDTLKYPTPVRASDVISAPYLDQLSHGPIMQSTDKPMLAIRQSASLSTTTRAVQSQPSETRKEPASTSNYTAAGQSSGASELTLASVPLPQVDDLSPPTFLTNLNPFRKKSPTKEQKDTASEDELRKLAQEKNYSPDVIAVALQQYPPGEPINKEHFMSTLETVHMIGQMVTQNVEETHQDADNSVILVDTEPPVTKSPKNTVSDSDKDTTAKGNTSQTKTKPIMDEEFEILDVSPMDLDSDLEINDVLGMKDKAEGITSSTETVARKRRRKKKSKNTGPLGSPQQPQKKQAAARLLQTKKEEQSESNRRETATVADRERASQQNLGNQPSKPAGQPESKSANNQSMVDKTIQDYLKKMESDVNPTELTWQQRFKLMEERLEILQTAMNQKEVNQDTGDTVQMTDKPEKKAADFSLPAANKKGSREEMVTSSSDKVSKVPEDDPPFTRVGAAGGVGPTGASSVSVSNQFNALNAIGGSSIYSLPYVMNRDTRVPTQKKNPVPDSRHDVRPKVVKPKRPLRQIVIDGSNVAMMHGNSQHFSCRGLQLAVDYFVKRGHKEITVFVPMWRRNYPGPANQIRDQHILEELQKKQFLTFTPSRKIPGGRSISSYDDRYVLRLAAETDGIVVSNDNFRDLWREKVEWREVIEKRILMFSFVGDRFMPPDDPLGRDGPSLDDFLQMPEGGVTNYSALGTYRPVTATRQGDTVQQPVAPAAPRPHEPTPLMQTNFPVGWNPPKMNSRPINRVSPAPHQKHKNAAAKAKQNTARSHEYDHEELRRQLKDIFVDQPSRVDKVLQRHPLERDLNTLSSYILEAS